MKTIIRYCLFVVLVGFCGGCRDAQPTTPVDESALRSLRVGGPPNISMLVLLAHAPAPGSPQPPFEWVPIQTGKLAMDAVIAGSIDVGILVDSNLAFVKFEGAADLVAFASIQRKKDDGLVARRDRKIGTVSDLKGKSVGYLPATTSHLFLARYFAAHGVDTADVKLVSMAPPAMQAAIVRGDVDAISVWQPFRFNAVTQLGDNAVEFRNAGEYVAQALLVVRRATLSTKGTAIAALLRRLLDAESRAVARQDDAVSQLATAIPMDRAALQHAWADYDSKVLLDDSLLTLLIEEGRWIAETQDGFKGRPLPDYASAIDGGPLRTVAPDRVTIRPAVGR